MRYWRKLANPCLYDKSDSEYKERDRKVNA